ncbi:MAG: hypothetical protein ABWY49_06080 [Rhizobium sp.]
MTIPDLTMFEALRDPMIRLMLRADQVPLHEFARLLQKAGEDRNRAISVALAPAACVPH